MDAGDGIGGAAPRATPHKIPESVLVVIHTTTLDVLLLERADHPGFWQSVTGSRASRDEPLRTSRRKPDSSRRPRPSTTGT